MLCWSLLELKEKIPEEEKEIMPSSFQFMYRSIPIAANQEITLTLPNCVEKSDASAEFLCSSSKMKVI